MIDRLKYQLGLITGPMLTLAVVEALVYVAIFVPCYYLCNALVDGELLILVLTGSLTEGIRRLAATATRMADQLEGKTG